MKTKGREVYTHINPGHECSIKATAPITERKDSTLHAIYGLQGQSRQDTYTGARSKPYNPRTQARWAY